MRIAAGSYRVPLYRIGDSIDVYAAYSNVNSGVVQGLFDVAGSGTIYGGRYGLGLPRLAGIDQRLALGFDWKAFDNVVTPSRAPSSSCRA